MPLRKPTQPPPPHDIFTALGQVRQPLWVFDIDRSRVHWANPGALAVWDATSLEELCSRDMAIDMSPAVAKRLLQYQSDFERTVRSLEIGLVLELSLIHISEPTRPY